MWKCDHLEAALAYNSTGVSLWVLFEIGDCITIYIFFYIIGRRKRSLGCIFIRGMVKGCTTGGEYWSFLYGWPTNSMRIFYLFTFLFSCSVCCWSNLIFLQLYIQFLCVFIFQPVNLWVCACVYFCARISRWTRGSFYWVWTAKTILMFLHRSNFSISPRCFDEILFFLFSFFFLLWKNFPRDPWDCLRWNGRIASMRRDQSDLKLSSFGRHIIYRKNILKNYL